MRPLVCEALLGAGGPERKVKPLDEISLEKVDFWACWRGG